MNVLMMPDYRTGNPYQQLLAKALERKGIHAAFPEGYRRGFPLRRAISDATSPVNVLHLHWLSSYLRGGHKVTFLGYALKLLADLALVRRAKIPVVWTIHNHLSHESRFPSLERWVRMKLSRLVTRVIVHSQAALQTAVDELHFDPRRAAIVPHGNYRGVYGPASDQASAREALGLPVRGRCFLFFGFVRPYKGIEQLLQAWKSNPDVSENHTLVVAGNPLDAQYGKAVETQARQCPGVVLHLKRIEDDKVAQYFSAADVAALPFRNILTSGSLMLAMSFDKPVIAPRLETLSEILGDASDLLYDPDDAEGLGRSLASAANAELRPIAARTRHRCDQFDWDEIGRRTSEVYQSALAEARI